VRFSLRSRIHQGEESKRCQVATRKRKALTCKCFFVAGKLFIRVLWTQISHLFEFVLNVFFVFFWWRFVRPFSEDELRNNAPQVVTCNDYQREVAVSQNIAGKHIDRVFTFDKVKLKLFLFI
jgi:hypothetical protein